MWQPHGRVVKGILALYSQAQIIPRVVPLEDEEISMEVRLPVREDELSMPAIRSTFGHPTAGRVRCTHLGVYHSSTWLRSDSEARGLRYENAHSEEECSQRTY